MHDIDPNSSITSRWTFMDFQREVILLYHLSRRKKKFSPCSVPAQPMECAITQPKKSHHSSNFQFLPMKTETVYNSSSQVCKRAFLYFFLSGLVHCSEWDCMSHLAILCCPWISPFCWRNICVSLFKVNTSKALWAIWRSYIEGVGSVHYCSSMFFIQLIMWVSRKLN